MRSFDETYLKMAKVWATNSRAIRAKVGALIVKNNQIISDGFNGTPSGFENECEEVICHSKTCLGYGACGRKPSLSYCTEHDNGCCELVTKPYVLHAEANAITKISKSNNNAAGATLYVTLSPCLECAKLIIQAGIKRVVYTDTYRKTDGIELLEKAGIKVEQLNI